MEDTMLFLTRTMLPAFALAAMMSVAQAQTATDQDHTAHHPGGAATTAQAQPGGQSGMMGNMGAMMPMMRQMMMGQQGGMGMPFEHAEGRIAFLKTELRITDAQTPQWNAFADTLRANAKAHQAMHEQMTKADMPSSWLERLAFQQKTMSTRLDGLKALETAAKPLYAVLTDDQKKLADQLLSGPMGMM
jgi:LTXXQ motif family protein